MNSTLSKGSWIRKRSGDVFGTSPTGLKLPVLQVLSLQNTWRKGNWIINGKYRIDEEALVVISEEEATRVKSIWEDSSRLCETRKSGLNTSCIREDNGEPKRSLPPHHVQRILFQARMKNPEGGFEAYKCDHCGGIHIGKTRTEPEQEQTRTEPEQEHEHLHII